MSLVRAVRPFLAARLRQAAPLREKVSFRMKEEISMASSTLFVCYTFSIISGAVLLYGGFYFIKQANARDALRAEYFQRTGVPEWKPRPWPPPSSENDEINANEAVAEEIEGAAGEEAKTVSTEDVPVLDNAHTESPAEVQKEEDSPIEEASSAAQEEEQGAPSEAEEDQTQD
ncbi:hypothetical protein JRQ81_016703 [Phrynocephalus forsythii]|uniref:Protein MGARP N-terminal domain-containing protein n=1 Tax=Phrynocephalus forsythii TaxID=171643 RepID=A0A9Q0XW15_9SAUR|nr:hypothetical protein JRQ81_016703 [Phrynocephalus forsythii]